MRAPMPFVEAKLSSGPLIHIINLNILSGGVGAVFGYRDS